MMLTQTHLPIMETENFKYVYGSLKFSIQERKLSVVLGAPGSGKTTVLNMFISNVLFRYTYHIYIIRYAPRSHSTLIFQKIYCFLPKLITIHTAIMIAAIISVISL